MDPSVWNFVTQFAAEQVQRLLKEAIVATIGRITAETARALGLRANSVGEEYNIPGPVGAIVTYYQAARDPI